jgi:putative phage-type endonuclease
MVSKMLTPEQLYKRKNHICGSDAAGLCGVSKYKTPVKVYLDKISDSIEQEENPIFERGHVLEPLVRGQFSLLTGKDVKLPKNMIIHEKNKFMAANIDGYLPAEKAIVEIKTANYFTKSEWGEAFTDNIPNDYLIQVQHYLTVSKMLKAYVVVLFGDEKMFNLLMTLVKRCGVTEVLKEALSLDVVIYEVKSHATLSQKLIDIERSFWFDHVQKRIEPKWEHSDDLIALFPQAQEGKKIVAQEDDFEVIREIQEHERVLKEITKPHEEKIELLKCKLQARIGDAEELVDFEGKKVASWKNTARSLFDAARFKAEMPNLYPQFLKTSQSRRLTF